MPKKLKHIESFERDCPHCIEWIKSDPRKDRLYISQTTTRSTGTSLTESNLNKAIKKWKKQLFGES